MSTLFCAEIMDGAAVVRSGEGMLLSPAGPVARMNCAKSPIESLGTRASRAWTWLREPMLGEAPFLGARGTGPEKVDFMGLRECIEDPFCRAPDWLFLSSLEPALLGDRERLRRFPSSLLRDLVGTIGPPFSEEV